MAPPASFLIVLLDLGDTQLSVATTTYNRQTQTVVFSLTDPERDSHGEEMGNTSAISPLGWDGPWQIKCETIKEMKPL